MTATGDRAPPSGLRRAVRAVAPPVLGAVVVLTVAELVAAAVGVVAWKTRTDPAFDLPSDEAAQVRVLQRWVATPGRARPLVGTSLWLYRPGQRPGLTIGDHGLRGLPPRPRTPGELRVAVLGGSSVFGWLVADEDTVPAALERELARRRPDRVPNVLNLGVEGYRFQQELELAERLLPELDPDVVVLLHGANDAIVGYDRGWVVDPPFGSDAPDPPLVVRFRRPGIAGVVRQIAGRSRVVTVLHEALLDRRVRDVQGSAAHLDAMVVGAVGLLDRLADDARAWNVPVVVAWQPTLSPRRNLDPTARARWLFAEGRQPGLTAFYDACTERVGGWAPPDGSRVRPVDLRAVLDGLDGRAFLDWVHPTPAGNAALAAALADIVEAELPGDG